MKRSQKIKNIAHVICVSLFMLMLVTACDNRTATPNIVEEDTTPPEDAVSVSLVITEDKTLSSATNRDIEYWEFMATPKFTLPNGEKVYGKVSYWRSLKELDTDGGNVKTTADLGRYTSGDWLFELRSLNSEHHVISVGSTQQVIRSGLDNVVTIEMKLDDADLTTHGQSWDTTSTRTQVEQSTDAGVETITRYGSVHIGFVANKLDLDKDNLSITLTRQKLTKNSVIGTAEVLTPDWTIRIPGEKYTNWYINADTDNYREISGDNTKAVEEGKMYFECTIPNHDAGAYVYTIVLNGKNESSSFIPLAGQSVSLYVMGNEETQIKGTLLANEYILTALKLDETGKIYGTINGGDEHDHYGIYSTDAPVSLKWEQSNEDKEKSKENGVYYYWFMDGELQEGNGDTISLSCPKLTEGRYAEVYAYGLHRVTVVVVGEQGSLGSGYFDMIFNPKAGASTSDEDVQFPWSDWGDKYERN